MATSVIPTFKASQTSTHIQILVDVASCPSTCSPRAVVDNGSIFGLACLHSHLPLVFPSDTLVDGSSILGEPQASSIALSRNGNTVEVVLLKRQEGKDVQGLESLKPSVFPLLEHDEEGQDEERLVGLDMLQRGMQAMRAQEVNHRKVPAQSSLKTSPSVPRPPRLSKNIKTRIHECFSEAELDVDERNNRRVAAYESEESKWDEGVYLDNYVDEDGEVEHLIKAALPPPSDRGVAHQGTIQASPNIQEDMQLLLLELLLAQAYDHRTTYGETTVESAWTIAVLCRSLVTSCIPSTDFGDTVATTLIGSMRRQLSFPLYRSWNLSIRVARDVVVSLRKELAIRLLSHILSVFEEAEDEAVGIYSAEVIAPLIEGFESFFSSASLSLLADQLESAIDKVTRSQVGGNWDMEELEIAAKEALQEGEGGYV